MCSRFQGSRESVLPAAVQLSAEGRWWLAGWQTPAQGRGCLELPRPHWVLSPDFVLWEDELTWVCSPISRSSGLSEVVPTCSVHSVVSCLAWSFLVTFHYLPPKSRKWERNMSLFAPGCLLDTDSWSSLWQGGGGGEVGGWGVRPPAFVSGI